MVGGPRSEEVERVALMRFSEMLATTIGAGSAWTTEWDLAASAELFAVRSLVQQSCAQSEWLCPEATVSPPAP